jgi:hypothetical protein
VIEFKFLNENTDNRPKTRDEVLIIVRDNLNILFDGNYRNHVDIDDIVEQVCRNLRIE